MHIAQTSLPRTTYSIRIIPIILPFSPSSENSSLMASENLQLKIELSKANAKIYNFEQKIIKNDNSHKLLMQRISELKKENQTMRRKVDSLQPEHNLPADADALQIRKVVIFSLVDNFYNSDYL